MSITIDSVSQLLALIQKHRALSNPALARLLNVSGTSLLYLQFNRAVPGTNLCEDWTAQFKVPPGTWESLRYYSEHSAGGRLPRVQPWEVEQVGHHWAVVNSLNQTRSADPLDSFSQLSLAELRKTMLSVADGHPTAQISFQPWMDRTLTTRNFSALSPTPVALCQCLSVRRNPNHYPEGYLTVLKHMADAALASGYSVDLYPGPRPTGKRHRQVVLLVYAVPIVPVEERQIMRLPNGQVAIVGGRATSGQFSDSHAFDEGTHTWPDAREC